MRPSGRGRLSGADRDRHDEKCGGDDGVRFFHGYDLGFLGGARLIASSAFS